MAEVLVTISHPDTDEVLETLLVEGSCTEVELGQLLVETISHNFETFKSG